MPLVPYESCDSKTERKGVKRRISDENEPPKISLSTEELLEDYKFNGSSTIRKRVKIQIPKIPDDIEEPVKKIFKKEPNKLCGLFDILPKPKNKPIEKSLKFDANIVKQKNLIPKSVKTTKQSPENSGDEEIDENDFFSFTKTTPKNKHLPQNLNFKINSAKPTYQSKPNTYFASLYQVHNQSESVCSENENIPTVDINSKEFKENWKMNAIKEETMPSSEEPKEEPSFLSKRKHQITYLAYEAKKNEEQMKNQWALNRMTRKQTQAKYGF